MTFIKDASNLISLQQELQIVLGKSVILEKEETHTLNAYLDKNYRKRQTTKSYKKNQIFKTKKSN